jgi:chromosome segregation ATPase
MRVERLDRNAHARLLAWLFVAALCAARAPLAGADEAADRLRLQALIEEAGLIVEEAAQLRPQAERLAEEGARLDAAEQALRAAQSALNDAVVRFNARNVELERWLQEHKAQCPAQSEDAALIETCNARAKQFNEAARQHEEERPLLQARQRELPARIEAQNTARREWALRKHELDPRLQANRGDAEYWLAAARTFLASDAFAALAGKAGTPAVCSAQALGDLNAAPPATAVERAYACLKALAAAG